MKHEHATRPTTQPEVPSFLTRPLQSRTKHFTSVSPPSSHSSEAAWGQWFRSGISSPWWSEREQWSMPTAWPIQATHANSCSLSSRFRKWSQLLNWYTSLKREPSAEAHCGNTRAVGASMLLCSGLQPSEHSFTLGVWALTPEGLCRSEKVFSFKKYFQGSLWPPRSLRTSALEGLCLFLVGLYTQLVTALRMKGPVPAATRVLEPDSEAAWWFTRQTWVRDKVKCYLRVGVEGRGVHLGSLSPFIEQWMSPYSQESGCSNWLTKPVPHSR